MSFLTVLALPKASRMGLACSSCCSSSPCLKFRPYDKEKIKQEKIVKRQSITHFTLTVAGKVTKQEERKEEKQISFCPNQIQDRRKKTNKNDDKIKRSREGKQSAHSSATMSTPNVNKTSNNLSFFFNTNQFPFAVSLSAVHGTQLLDRGYGVFLFFFFYRHF